MFINRRVLRRIGWNEAEKGNLFCNRWSDTQWISMKVDLSCFTPSGNMAEIFFTNIEIVVKLGNDEILLREKFT